MSFVAASVSSEASSHATVHIMLVDNVNVVGRAQLKSSLKMNAGKAGSALSACFEIETERSRLSCGPYKLFMNHS